MSPVAGGVGPWWASAWGDEPEFGPYAEIEVGGVVQRFRWIPPGRFIMGSPESEDGRFDDEGPRHEVVLTDGYWLGDTPVTQGMWHAVLKTRPSHFQGDELPVENVSHDDACGFLQALNEREDSERSLRAQRGLMTSTRWRLPTDAEWERACRGGVHAHEGSAFWCGSESREVLDAIAWHEGNSGGVTHPVGGKQPNSFGLYDMLGNVWEWCADGLRDYESGSITDPAVQGSYWVNRGGSFAVDARYCRAACRFASHPGNRWRNRGFRLARGRALRGGAQEAEAEPASAERS